VKTIRQYVGSLFVIAALAIPMVTVAMPGPQDDHDRNRVYDRDHKDYHNWDDRENQAWNRFLEENHRAKHGFAKANRREQSEYWKWRHEHPDHD
jgi:hypothetical protein